MSVRAGVLFEREHSAAFLLATMMYLLPLFCMRSAKKETGEMRGPSLLLSVLDARWREQGGWFIACTKRERYPDWLEKVLQMIFRLFLFRFKDCPCQRFRLLMQR